MALAREQTSALAQCSRTQRQEEEEEEEEEEQKVMIQTENLMVVELAGRSATVNGPSGTALR